MKTRSQQIADAFDLLRTQCDPRGHALLEAMENLWLVESAALDCILDIPEPPSNVVSMIDGYSMKVPCA